MRPTPTLLIVDDTPITRHTLVRLLMKTCPQAVSVVAADVAQARHLLQGNNVTGVLTDFHLPDGTGLDVLAAVQRLSLGIPVVVISGDTQVKSTVTQAGAAAFVPKPFDLDSFSDLLIRLCADPG